MYYFYFLNCIFTFYFLCSVKVLENVQCNGKEFLQKKSNVKESLDCIILVKYHVNCMDRDPSLDR